MNKNLTAIAKDNTIRVSPLKLANIARLIVNQKVDKAIEKISYKQIHKIKDWQEANPDWPSNDKKLKEWQLMVQNLSGPTNDEDMEKETKTIKKKLGENTGIKEAISTVEIK